MHSRINFAKKSLLLRRIHNRERRVFKPNLSKRQRNSRRKREMLRYSKELSADILKCFDCGIQVMDDFIHHALNDLLAENPHYNLYVASSEDCGVVAMFVTSNGAFIDSDGSFQDLPYGKPWGYFDDNSHIQTGTMYPTLEIDYLAVRKDLQNRGFGTEIIEYLAGIASSNNLYFLTVDAYHKNNYSAIPFYEKQNFFAIQEYSDEFDTLRMVRRVI